MKILVACEFSGAVRRAFRERGHDALATTYKINEYLNRERKEKDAKPEKKAGEPSACVGGVLDEVRAIYVSREEERTQILHPNDAMQV